MFWAEAYGLLQNTSKHHSSRGAQKLMGDNLKAVRAEFSTLSQTVFIMSVIA
jgi:hypothetical protein